MAETQIPDSWNVSNTEEVTVDPVLNEEGVQLSGSGAGPQYTEIRGTIELKPCSECGEAMVRDNSVLRCSNGHIESAKLDENDEAQGL